MGIRDEIVGTMHALARQGLIQGSSGNVSARDAAAVWITRSGARPERMSGDDVVRMGLDGEHDPEARPSSEWRMHLEIYRVRGDAGAVVHTHSPYATAVSCLRRDLPAFHYMVGAAGGDSIRCARHATVASPELAAAAVEALEDRDACLLANHGTLALGADLDAARHLAEEVEHLARVFCIARAAGEPVLLDDEEMARVLQAFRRYRDR